MDGPYGWNGIDTAKLAAALAARFGMTRSSARSWGDGDACVQLTERGVLIDAQDASIEITPYGAAAGRAIGIIAAALTEATR